MDLQDSFRMESEMNGDKPIAFYAYEILKKKGKPLHYVELTKLIMKRKEIKGKTPWKTVNAAICTNPKFKRIGKRRSGTYALSEWDKK